MATGWSPPPRPPASGSRSTPVPRPPRRVSGPAPSPSPGGPSPRQPGEPWAAPRRMAEAGLAALTVVQIRLTSAHRPRKARIRARRTPEARHPSAAACHGPAAPRRWPRTPPAGVRRSADSSDDRTKVARMRLEGNQPATPAAGPAGHAASHPDWVSRPVLISTSSAARKVSRRVDLKAAATLSHPALGATAQGQPPRPAPSTATVAQPELVAHHQQGQAGRPGVEPSRARFVHIAQRAPASPDPRQPSRCRHPDCVRRKRTMAREPARPTPPARRRAPADPAGTRGSPTSAVPIRAGTRRAVASLWRPGNKSQRRPIDEQRGHTPGVWPIALDSQPRSQGGLALAGCQRPGVQLRQPDGQAHGQYAQIEQGLHGDSRAAHRFAWWARPHPTTGRSRRRAGAGPVLASSSLNVLVTSAAPTIPSPCRSRFRPGRTPHP